ncbi:MAG: hypothetical protein WKG07_12580 [Hymenobacter sp.]
MLNAGEKQQLLLSCAAAGDVRQVYWYVNDRFLQAAPAAGAAVFPAAHRRGQNILRRRPRPHHRRACWCGPCEFSDDIGPKRG